MQVKNKRITDINPYEQNCKKHSSKQIKNVAQSIKKYGFVQPIVIDKDNCIVIGHCRYEAACLLNMVEVPCVQVENLTEEQIKQLRVVDNKTNESEWNIDFLTDELPNIDLSMFDFDFMSMSDEPKDVEDKSITQSMLEKMELRVFEHYDYLVFVFENSYDWLYIANEFNLKKVNAGYGKTKKVGIGRVINGERLIERIRHTDTDNK